MPRAARKTTKKILTMPKPAPSIASTNLSAADIAQRAFELYCARGCQHGFDLEDWLQAERELRAATSSAA